MPYVVLDKLLGGADLMLPGIYQESYPADWGTGDVSSGTETLIFRVVALPNVTKRGAR